MMRLWGNGCLITILFVSMCVGYGGTQTFPDRAALASPAAGSKISHVVIIFQENRSTDNLFHGLRGADTAGSGRDSAGNAVAMRAVGMTAPYDPDHTHHGFVAEYNEGKMNGFDRVAFNCPNQSCNPMTAYGYVPRSDVAPYFTMAERYTFADRMFQTNQGPTFPAHLYIISGTSTNAPDSPLLAAENPYYKVNGGNCGGSPETLVKMIDRSGNENTSLPPCFDHRTLTDLLDAKNLSWKYYAPAPDGLFNGPSGISHIRFGADWANVVSPATQIYADISAQRLPAVSWVNPAPAQSDHALSNDGTGPSWVASIVNAVGKSPYWKNTAIFITWDDWGGWYDHVKPKIYNSYELGFRVPLIVVSPYARRGYVSHRQHEFGSLIHFVETNFGLPSLGFTDARSDNLADCFNFNRAPIAFRTIRAPKSIAYFLRLPQPHTVADTDF